MTALQPAAVATRPPDDGLGSRLRGVRRARRRTLRAVAEVAGVSESFLSQVERGRANPSVSSLTRIAEALDLGLHDLFAPVRQEGSLVVRASGSAPLEFGEGASKWLLTPQPLQDLEVVVCQYAVGGHSGDEPYVHGDSEETCVVLEGTIELRIGDEVLRLSAGDAATFRSSQPHRTANTGDVPARVLHALTPPT